MTAPPEPPTRTAKMQGVIEGMKLASFECYTVERQLTGSKETAEMGAVRCGQYLLDRAAEMEKSAPSPRPHEFHNEACGCCPLPPPVTLTREQSEKLLAPSPRPLEQEPERIVLHRGYSVVSPDRWTSWTECNAGEQCAMQQHRMVADGAAYDALKNKYDTLAAAVNEHDGPCDFECDSRAHTDACKHVSNDYTLVLQQQALAAARERIAELEKLLREAIEYISKVTSWDLPIHESPAQQLLARLMKASDAD